MNLGMIKWKHIFKKNVSVHAMFAARDSGSTQKSKN